MMLSEEGAKALILVVLLFLGRPGVRVAFRNRRKFFPSTDSCVLRSGEPPMIPPVARLFRGSSGGNVFAQRLPDRCAAAAFL